MNKIKILIVAANPWDTNRLELDKELREIANLLKKGKTANKFEVEQLLAARSDDLLDELQVFEPNIVHFSGHGEEDYLTLTDDNSNSHEIKKDVLTELFSLCNKYVNCVFLNACNSESIAYAIAHHIDYAIGMSAKIDDIAAIKFSKGFYRALFNGGTIEEAYRFALIELKLAKFINQQDIPILYNKKTLTQPNQKAVQQSYVSNYQYDILIHAANNEQDWTLDFKEELQKYLIKEMNNQICYLSVQTDDKINLEQAAINLFVISCDYIKQYQEILKNLIKPEKKQYAIARSENCPDELSGLSKYKFYTEQIDASNSPELHELAKIIAQQLQSQKKQFEFNKTTNPFSEPLVFIHTEPKPDAKQVESVKDLKLRFRRRGLACAIVNPKVYKEDVKLNQKNCDGVLIVYGTDYLWARQRIDEYYQLKQRRKEPLKIIIIHADCSEEPKDIEGLDIYDNVPVFPCPPEDKEELINRFESALKQGAEHE